METKGDDDICTYSYSIHKFVTNQKELLDLELQAENEESRPEDSRDKERQRSHILGRLEASEVTVGLYGKTVVRLTSTGGLSLLPAHRFTVGNEVEIRTKQSSTSKTNLIGVVSTVTNECISVAIFQDKQQSPSSKGKKKGTQSKENEDEDDDESGVLDCPPLTLVPRSSIEVHKKLVASLERLERHGEGHPIAGSVIRTMFGAPRTTSIPKEPPQHQSFNTGLDDSQKDAIAFALHPHRKVALIHGPPGTGKTTTVAELIRQAVHYHGMRVLVTAPSNVAVDNILERLTEADGDSKIKMRTVRLGHPSRIKPSIVNYSLEALVQTSDGTEIVADVRKELESYLKLLSGSRTKGTCSGNNKQHLIAKLYDQKKTAFKEIRSLRKEIRQREEKVVQDLIGSAHVVLATTVGADNRVLNHITHPKFDTAKKGFDLVIIDEAAQALEASCWIPILRGRKVVLAGDHCQLPPTIKSKDPRALKGLSKTLFERLMNLYKGQEDRISRMLQIQYRMHHSIADWASQAMYHGDLLTHDSVKNRTLSQLDSVMRKKEKEDDNVSHDESSLEHLKDTTLLLIDTAGCNMHEQETEAGSRFNEGEAMLVSDHVRKLLGMGVEENQIAIITPYNGQVDLLRNELLGDFPRLEIKSVDGFQGGERDAVVLSLVRSSHRDGIGFLKDDRRQNVAVTRAKRHLALICDSETVSQSSFIKDLIEWIEEHGEQRSAIEYLASSNADSNQEYEEDLLTAEVQLMKLVEQESSTKLNAAVKPRAAISKSSKPSASKEMKRKSRAQQQQTQQRLDESEKKALMDEIQKFMERGKKGEEMPLSSDLSSADRHMIHEFAEKEGLGHRSEGTAGVDRKIILVIESESSTASEVTNTTISYSPKETEEEDPYTATEVKPTFASTFLALSGDESESDEDPIDEKQNAENEPITDPPSGNSLLAQLAKERATRQQQQHSKAKATTASAASKKRVKKSKRQKLGGAAKTEKAGTKEDDNLDDMAFLDAQIEKSQNAHGRRVEGVGKGYRTVVNGVLNFRPAPPSKPKNINASSALRSKLSEAGNARKKKTKKK